MWKIILVLIGILSAMSVHACQCVNNPTLLESFEKAEHVVVAQIRVTRDTESDQSYRWNILEVLKGDKALTLEPGFVEYARGVTSCYVPAVDGAKWLLFLDHVKRVWLSQCSLHKTIESLPVNWRETLVHPVKSGAAEQPPS